MIRVILVLLGLLALALAVLAATMLGPDAMAVVVGVVCGIGAMIPVSLLMLYIVTQRERVQEPPHIIVIQPPPREERPQLRVIQGRAQIGGGR
jgi:hypothetical protein